VKLTKRLILCTILTLIFNSTGTSFATAKDPRDDAVDASEEAINAYDAAKLAIDLSLLAKEQCKNSFYRFAIDAKLLAQRSGLLVVCDSLDGEIAEFKRDLGNPVSTDAMSGEELIKWINFYNLMTDYANAISEEMDILTLINEDTEEIFSRISLIEQEVSKLISLVDSELSALSKKIEKLPTILQNSTMRSSQYRSLLSMRVKIINANRRVTDSINFLPNIKTFEDLEAEEERMIKGIEGLPSTDSVKQSVETIVAGIPKSVCRKGNSYRLLSKGAKCPSGFKKFGIQF